ncbi:hypothetical protein IMZ48_29210 [Candidatus Bathyarchaeota archaeon]|nr:hypothetical protein [Candidatus Bathyarchaeota archaeon]
MNQAARYGLVHPRQNDNAEKFTIQSPAVQAEQFANQSPDVGGGPNAMRPVPGGGQPITGTNHALQDHQLQLMLLDRQKSRDADHAAHSMLLEELLMTPAEMDGMAEAGQHGALLQLQLAIHAVYGLYKEENSDIFLQRCRAMINLKTSSLVATLDALPEIWPAEHLSTPMTLQLFDLYLDVCTHSTDPEPRAIALRNLTDLMVDPRGREEVRNPSRASLEGLWAGLQEGPMSPSLSDEILRAGGAVLGYLLATEADGFDSAAALRRYGAMIAESSTDDKVSPPHQLTLLIVFILTPPALRHALLRRRVPQDRPPDPSPPNRSIPPRPPGALHPPKRRRP